MRRAVRRFMPGEDMQAALAEAERLQTRGMTALLTLLGENVKTPAEADSVAEHYLGVLDQAKERSLDVQISVKPTQLCLDAGLETALQKLRSLAERAAAFDTMVWIDMEGSDYTDVTLDLYRRICEPRGSAGAQDSPTVGICLQAYLHRTAEDLESLLPLRPSIRLVKGAYAEPPEIAFASKADVDRNFLKLAGRLLDEAGPKGRVWPTFGTHDPKMIRSVQTEADARQLPKSAYEIEMLYGIGREEQVRLAAAGYPMRVLISYGTSWFPWYMRRLAERPANIIFVVKSAFAG